MYRSIHQTPRLFLFSHNGAYVKTEQIGVRNQWDPDAPWNAPTFAGKTELILPMPLPPSSNPGDVRVFLPPGLLWLNITVGALKGSGIVTRARIGAPPDPSLGTQGALQGRLLDARDYTWWNQSAAGSYVVCAASAYPGDWGRAYPTGCWLYLSIGWGTGGFQNLKITMRVSAGEFAPWFRAARDLFGRDGDPPAADGGNGNGEQPSPSASASASGSASASASPSPSAEPGPGAPKDEMLALIRQLERMVEAL